MRNSLGMFFIFPVLIGAASTAGFKTVRENSNEDVFVVVSGLRFGACHVIFVKGRVHLRKRSTIGLGMPVWTVLCLAGLAGIRLDVRVRPDNAFAYLGPSGP